MAVLVGTGMRLDEALHLMWTDIDLQHRVIHVHRGATVSSAVGFGGSPANARPE